MPPSRPFLLVSPRSSPLFFKIYASTHTHGQSSWDIWHNTCALCQNSPWNALGMTPVLFSHFKAELFHSLVFQWLSPAYSLSTHPFCTFPPWPLTAFCLRNLTRGPFSLPVICSVPGRSEAKRRWNIPLKPCQLWPLAVKPSTPSCPLSPGLTSPSGCLRSFEVIFDLSQGSLGVL